MTLPPARERHILALKAGGCYGAMCDYGCFYMLGCSSPFTCIRGSWGLSPCYIPCRFAWSEAFICICSCRPSVTTTACASRPVSERQQLKGKVVFVHLCQMQSKTHFHPHSRSPHPPNTLLLVSSLASHITAMSPQFNASSAKHISCPVKSAFWHLLTLTVAQTWPDLPLNLA